MLRKGITQTVRLLRSSDIAKARQFYFKGKIDNEKTKTSSTNDH